MSLCQEHFIKFFQKFLETKTGQKVLRKARKAKRWKKRHGKRIRLKRGQKALQKARKTENKAKRAAERGGGSKRQKGAASESSDAAPAAVIKFRLKSESLHDADGRIADRYAHDIHDPHHAQSFFDILFAFEQDRESEPRVCADPRNKPAEREAV